MDGLFVRMGGTERWKPVFFIFIFAFAFFEFSQVPFTEPEMSPQIPVAVHTYGGKSVIKRSIDNSQSVALNDHDSDYSGSDNPEISRSKRRSKKSNPYYDDGVRVRSQRRLKKKTRFSNKDISRSSSNIPRKYYQRYKSIPEDENYDYDFNDEELYKSASRKKSSKRKKYRKFDTKRKASLIFKAPSNFSLLNPKAPLDLPIVKPEMFKEDNTTSLIATKNRPFHFHIPVVSKNPETPLSIDELMKIALQYKNPLTLDDNEIKSAPVSQTLSQKQRSTMRRIVRDSPALDFLNIASLVTVSKRSTSDPEEETAKVNSSSQDLSNLKRDVVVLTATDELLQEVLGDKDDLVELQERLKSRAAYSEEVVKKSEYIVGSDLFTSKVQDKIDKNSIRRKRTGSFYDFYDDTSAESLNEISQRSQRVKRGLGKWLKKMFGKKTTTTTTTKSPRKKKKESSEESSRGKKDSKQGRKSKSKSDYFELKTDENGDTEVDKLLPTYLRRSSYLGRKNGEDAVTHKKKKAAEDSYEKEP